MHPAFQETITLTYSKKHSMSMQLEHQGSFQNQRVCVFFNYLKAFSVSNEISSQTLQFKEQAKF